MLKIKQIPIPGYAKVIEGVDSEVGLHCYIAVHDCSLGPALGGTRIYPYVTDEAALTDAIRLAKAMTYKSAIVENGLGGGKSVIIADPHKGKTESLLRAFGQVVDSLKGMYIAAEDVGSNMEDMAKIRESTPYVVAFPSEKSSGDPSRFTAWGVFRGMQAVAQEIWQTTSLKGKKIAIQGVGSVGGKLAQILFWEGADLLISDFNKEKSHEMAVLCGAQEIDPKDLLTVDCDIFAPCALGGELNDQTIPLLKCRAVAGSANNQLLDSRHGMELKKRNILYAPDYVINAGGIINAAIEFHPGGYNPKIARDRVDRIYDTLLTVFAKAKEEDKPTSEVADELAEYKLKERIGKRLLAISF